MAEHTPDEANMYIIDCGAETLKMFNNIPHVGEVATIEDSNLVNDIFDMLNKEMERRKELFSDYAGSYNEYINNSGKKLPLIVTVINNYEIFEENFRKLSEEVQNLYRDGSKYGLVFIISAVGTNAIRGRMAQNFNNHICLEIPDASYYRELVSAPRGLSPSKGLGRGLVEMNDTAYEFQTAMFAPRNEMTNVVREVSKQLNSAYTTRAKKIPTIPKIVDESILKQSEYTLDKLPVGYDIKTKELSYYSFNDKFNQIVTMDMTKEGLSFVNSVIDLISTKAKTSIVDVTLYKDNFDKAIVDINNEAMQNKNTNQDYYYIFLGIGSIRKSVQPDVLAVINNLFTNISSTNNIHVLFIDTYESYKNLHVEQWYQTCINPMNGIWLGPDAGNQLVINMPQLTMDDKKLNFQYMAFTVSNGKHNIIKHMTEVEDDNNEG